jgi:hypothetical protein
MPQNHRTEERKKEGQAAAMGTAIGPHHRDAATPATSRLPFASAAPRHCVSGYVTSTSVMAEADAIPSASPLRVDTDVASRPARGSATRPCDDGRARGCDLVTRQANAQQPTAGMRRTALRCGGGLRSACAAAPSGARRSSRQHHLVPQSSRHRCLRCLELKRIGDWESYLFGSFSS